MRSVIRWAGSKKKLLPTLASIYVPDSARYVEPFAGSAAFFFHLKPKRAALNDTNFELISALKTLKRDPQAVYSALAALPRKESVYYELRSKVPSSLAPFDRAIRFFYLNRFCFNGIYRTNKRGEFNVPFASSRSGAIPSREEWVAAAKILGRAKLCSNDFETFCRREVRSGDFVYLDPPYAVSNRRIFRQYSKDEFGSDDMRRLDDLLVEIDRRGARFLMSYAMSPEGLEVARKWVHRRATALRNVAGFQQHRRRAVELLIYNFEVR